MVVGSYKGDGAASVAQKEGPKPGTRTPLQKTLLVSTGSGLRV